MRQAGKGVPKNMNKEIILAKIKKLFALSKSNNINEAETALRKAKELMQIYNIDCKNEEFYEESLQRKTSNWWICIIAEIISRFYECKVFMDKNKRISIIGEELGIKLSNYAIVFIIRTMNRMIREYKINTRYCTINKIYSYIKGILVSLNEKFPEKENIKTKEIQEYISKNYTLRVCSVGKNIKASNALSLNEGYIDGQKIKIYPGINTEIGKGLLS